MNVRLNYSIEFTAGFYFNNMLKMNNYKIRLAMMTATPEEESINIAFERIKYFIGESIDSGVFINRGNEEQCKLLANAGVKIITLPDIISKNKSTNSSKPITKLNKKEHAKDHHN